MLTLSQPVDDTAWARAWHGAFYANDHVDVFSGTFWPGTTLVAVTPGNANSAPASCPGPRFPASYPGQMNVDTGQITRVRLRGAGLEPQGLIFAARCPSSAGWRLSRRLASRPVP